MGFFDNQHATRIPQNIDIPGVTVVNEDLEFTEEYIDKCRTSTMQLLAKDMKEAFDSKGVSAGHILISATLNGDERFHSLWILFKNIHDLKLDFNIVKDGDNFFVQLERVNKPSFFKISNKHRIGKTNPNKPDKVYSYIPNKIIRYVSGYDYSGKEVPMAMEYDLTENKLKIYTGIVGRPMSDYKLTIVDVGVWVSEPEMKRAVDAVSGALPDWCRSTPSRYKPTT